MQKVLEWQHTIPIVFIVVLIFAFFWKVFFLGHIPLPADLLLNAYFPWHDYAWPPFTAGVVPVKNAEHADAISQFFPFAKFTYEQLRAGSMPLWNPLIGSGMPFLASYHTSVLSPINLLVFVTPVLTFWALSVIVPVFSFGLFSYLFFKQLVPSRWAALIGAIAVMLSSFTMFWLEYGPGLKTAMWTPLLLLAVFKFFQTQKYFWFPIMAIATALLATGGDVQTFIYSLTLAGIFGIYLMYGYNSIKTACVVIAGMLLGIGIASPQLLLTYEFQQLSGRGDLGFKYLSTVDFGLTTVNKLVTLVAPDYFGNMATKNYWNTHYYFSGLVYLSVLPLILSFFSFLRKEKIVYILWSTLGIIAIFFYDWPVSRLIYEAKVPFFSTISANRMFFLAIFILATLSVYGAQEVLTVRKNKRHLLLIGIFPVLIAILTVVTFLLREFGSEKLVENLTISLRNLVLPLFFTTAYTAGIWLLIKRPANNIVKLAILIMFVAELLRFGFKVTPFVPKSFVFPEVATTKFLKEDQSLYRVGGSIPSNFFMPYNITSAEGYDSLTLKVYSEFIAAANKSEAPGAYLEYLRSESILLNIANVKYIIETKYTDKGEPSFDGQPSLPLRTSQFTKVLDDKSVGVFRNNNVLQRAMLFYDYEVAGRNDVLQKLRDESFNYSSTVLLEKEPGIQKSNNTQATGSAEITLYRPKEVVVETKSTAPAVLFLADTYYPGWQATVDDKNTEILIANNTFRALSVPAGNHTVRFAYNPSYWKTGTKITLLCSLLTILSTIAISKLRRKQIDKNLRTKTSKGRVVGKQQWTYQNMKLVEPFNVCSNVWIHGFY